MRLGRRKLSGRLTDALTGAVAAFTSNPTKVLRVYMIMIHDPLQPVGVSPGRSVELRVQTLEQLQQLYDDGILAEYTRVIAQGTWHMALWPYGLTRNS